MLSDIACDGRVVAPSEGGCGTAVHLAGLDRRHLPTHDFGQQRVMDLQVAAGDAVDQPIGDDRPDGVTERAGRTPHQLGKHAVVDRTIDDR